MRAFWPVLTLILAPAPAAAQLCQLCAPQAAPAAAPTLPIHVDIQTGIDFSTAAHTDLGAGSIEVDSRTGNRRLSGLIGIGGAALRGEVTVTGQPLRRVTIKLPTAIRLNSTMGAKADVTDIRTSLGPDPMIGPDGRLVFWFGGRLSVIDNAAGDFHGRVQISVEYQ